MWWSLCAGFISELLFSRIWDTPQVTHLPHACGIFYFPCWHGHQIEETKGFYCLLRKTLAKWGNEIATRHNQPHSHLPPSTLPQSRHSTPLKCKMRRFDALTQTRRQPSQLCPETLHISDYIRRKCDSLENMAATNRAADMFADAFREVGRFRGVFSCSLAMSLKHLD